MELKWDESPVGGVAVGGMAAHGLVNGMSGASPTGMSEANLPRPYLRRARKKTMKTYDAKSWNHKKTFRLSAWREGATLSIIMHSFAGCYKNACGLLAKNSLWIHTQIKWCLIINVLRVLMWHRPARRQILRSFQRKALCNSGLKTKSTTFAYNNK